MDPLTVVGGLVLLFVLPGYLLLHAVFPGRRYFGTFHAVALPVLSVATSVALVVLVGTLLGFLPGSPTGDGRGWFQGRRSGAPILEAAMGILCAGLFALAWWRGSFGLLRSPRHPHGRLPARQFEERPEPEDVTLLRDLRLEEERLRRESRRVRARAAESRDVGVRTALEEAADQLDEERAIVARHAADVEKRAGERRYGVGGKERPPRWIMRLRRP